MKILKFTAYNENRPSRKGAMCVVGALGMTTNTRIDPFPYACDSGVKRLSEKTGISIKSLRGLIKLNDQYQWRRLSNRLISLGIYNKVKRFAKEVVEVL